MHVIAAKAVAFKEAQEPSFTEYQKQVVVNAKAMAKVVLERGYKVVSGGTDNHLFLWDLTPRSLTGKVVEAELGKAHITVNKNAVPNDPQSPFVTSGIRVGTPAMTTRGFNERDATDLATWMCDIIDSIKDDAADPAIIDSVREKVSAICKRLPVYES
jgi:glycine hydroxymethyltransferase